MDGQHGGRAQRYLFVPQVFGGGAGQRPAQNHTGGMLDQPAQLDQLYDRGAQRRFHVARKADAVACHRHKGGGLGPSLGGSAVQVDHGAGAHQQVTALIPVQRLQLFLHMLLGRVFPADLADRDPVDAAGDSHFAVADMLVHQYGAVFGPQHLCRQPDPSGALLPQRQHRPHLAAHIRLVVDGVHQQHSAAVLSLPQLFGQRPAVGLIHDIGQLRRFYDLLRRHAVHLAGVFGRLRRGHLLYRPGKRRLLHLLQHHAAPVQPPEYSIGQLHGFSPSVRGSLRPFIRPVRPARAGRLPPPRSPPCQRWRCPPQSSRRPRQRQRQWSCG